MVYTTNITYLTFERSNVVINKANKPELPRLAITTFFSMGNIYIYFCCFVYVEN